MNTINYRYFLCLILLLGACQNATNNKSANVEVQPSQRKPVVIKDEWLDSQMGLQADGFDKEILAKIFGGWQADYDLTVARYKELKIKEAETRKDRSQIPAQWNFDIEETARKNCNLIPKLEISEKGYYGKTGLYIFLENSELIKYHKKYFKFTHFYAHHDNYIGITNFNDEDLRGAVFHLLDDNRLQWSLSRHQIIVFRRNDQLNLFHESESTK